MKLSEGLTADQKCCVVAKKKTHIVHIIWLFSVLNLVFLMLKAEKISWIKKLHFIFTYKYDGMCLSFNFRKLMT